MGLFDIFRKKVKLPERYVGRISENDFQFLIDICKKYHLDRGIKISNIVDGAIIIELEGETQYCHLDNLIRRLSAFEKPDWEKEIFTYFNNGKNNSEAYSYLFKDFDYAKQFLRVFIKADDFLLEGILANFVHRTDFPRTYTFLVFDFENQFRYIQHIEIKEWNVPIEELFEIGIASTPGNEVRCIEKLYCERFPVFVFLSGDYSASLALDISERADFVIGTYGSMIAIPTKGTVFLHPLESPDIRDLITALKPEIYQFYNDDPGQINTELYWYYKGLINIFPGEPEGDKYFIRFPQGLLTLFNNGQ